MPSFMKASRRDEDAGEGGRVAKKNKMTTKAAADPGNELTKLIHAIGQLSMDTARETRDLSGIIMQNILVENSEAWAQEGVEEGKTFWDLVKAHPGENLGSPHIRIGLRCLHSLIMDKEANSEFLKGMTQWWKESIQDKSQAEVAEELQIFKVRQPKVGSKTWRKQGVGKTSEEEMEDASYTKVTICLRNSNVQRAVVMEMVRRGGLLKTGSAPMSPSEREVKRLLTAARKWT